MVEAFPPAYNILSRKGLHDHHSPTPSASRRGNPGGSPYHRRLQRPAPDDAPPLARVARSCPQPRRSAIAKEASDALAAMEKNSPGQSALFSLIGHKGDLMLIHFRESFDDLNQAELQVADLRLCDYLEPTTSYLSIIELGLYDSTLKIYKELADQGIEPHSDQWKAEIECKLNRQQRSDAPASLSGNSAASLRLFLSHGPPTGRRQELVHASD